MTDLVVDCSVTMAWCFEDEADAYCDGVLGALREGVGHAPALWGLEVVNVLLVAERRQRLRRADAHRFLELLHELPIELDHDPPAMDRLLSMGHEHVLSAYDTAYLDLAMRLGLPLATRDAALQRACERGGVPLFRTA
jgi:predicted nucleic acid-binding protein